MPKLQHQLRAVLQLGVLRNQVLQPAAIFLDRSWFASQPGVVLDHVHEDQACVELHGERGCVLGSKSCVAGEIGGEQDLPQLQLRWGKIASGELGQLCASQNSWSNRENRA